MSIFEKCKCGRLCYTVRPWWGLPTKQVCKGCDKERDLCECSNLMPEGIK